MRAKIWGTTIAKTAIALFAAPPGLLSSQGSLIAVLLIAPFFVPVLWIATHYTHRFMIGSVVILTLVPIVGVTEHRLLHPGVLGLIAIAFAASQGYCPVAKRVSRTRLCGGADVYRDRQTASVPCLCLM
ncbi:MAG: hypothetical protein WA484_10425 [Solirubrobacteraceae bacterium]